MSDRYLLHSTVEPFMQTQKKRNGYTTSYAQIRIHHRTHVDFPPHVGMTGSPDRDLSGSAAIREPDELTVEDGELAPIEGVPGSVPEILLMETGGQDLPSSLVTALSEDETIRVVGTDAERVGNLKVHQELLKAGAVLLENLVKLDAPTVREGFAYVYPVVLEGCDDGAPTVVVFEQRE